MESFNQDYKRSLYANKIYVLLFLSLSLSLSLFLSLSLSLSLSRSLSLSLSLSLSPPHPFPLSSPFHLNGQSRQDKPSLSSFSLYLLRERR